MRGKRLGYKLFILIQLLSLPFAISVSADSDYLYSALTEVAADSFNARVSDNSGAYTYTYPLSFPEGRNGLQPNFQLQYNNQDEDQSNIAGYGWAFSIPYINRVPKRGVDNLYPNNIDGSWDPDDYFFYSSISEEILPIDPTTTTERIYGAKAETGDFLNYEFTNNHWVVTDKFGTVYTFGSSTSARQNDSNNTDNVYKWMLEEVRDTNDNYIRYDYYKDNGMMYPSSTIYTGHGSTDGIYEVIFNRESRDDTPILYNTGFLVQPMYRISDIEVKINGVWKRKYDFEYTAGDNGKRSLLQTITESGNDNGSVLTLPATTFSYESKTVGFTSDGNWAPDWTIHQGIDVGQRIADINGDGLADMFMYNNSYNMTYLNDGDNGFTSVGGSFPEKIKEYNNLDNGVRFGDVDADGFEDAFFGRIYNGVPEDTKVYMNDGNVGWEENMTASSTGYFTHIIPYIHAYDQCDRIADINGDGFADILTQSGTAENTIIYINNTDGTGWTSSSTYSLPVDFSLCSGVSQQKERIIFDVNGDGLVDFIEVREKWHEGSPYNEYYPVVEACLNKDGGKHYDCVNTLTLGDDYSSYSDIYGANNGGQFMDVNGDGLIDYARSHPRNGTQYNGVFINKGDGTGWEYDDSQDIPVYFLEDLGGGDWQDNGIRAVDANGDGLTDFTDNQTEAVYLNNGYKPDLLVKVETSKGATTEVDYKMAQLYKDSDNDQANPDLPIMVNTVENVIVNDGFGNIATTTYNYGGGEYYFNNGFDKRFAGFATTTINDSVGNIIKRYFHQGNDTSIASIERNDDPSKINFMYREDIFDDSDNLYKQTLNKYDNTDLGNSRDFVCLSETLIRDYDGDDDSKDSAQTFIYSTSTGNLTQQTNWGEVTVSSGADFTDSGSDKLIEQYEYATDGDYLVGLMSKNTTLNNASSTVKEIKNYYWKI